MGKKEIFEVPILKNIARSLGAFPVDRFGRDLKALRHSVALINDNKTLGIFPEGTRVKTLIEKMLKMGLPL